MDRIAIISDIHGNLEALKTVLKDIEKREIKTIYCLGDIIAKGVNSRECIKLIKEHCQVILRGNCDEYFSSNLELDNLNETERNRVIWNKSLLTEEEQEFLLNLPFCHEFYMSGSLVRLFHATPNKINGFISNLDSIDKKRSLFLPTENTISQKNADVIIYGHTHIQNLEKLYNKTIVNVGSVGNSVDVIRNENIDSNAALTTRANYLIMEGNYGSKSYDEGIAFQLINIPYDIDKELKSPMENIEKEAYSYELREGKYRDMEVLRKSFISRNIDMDSF